MQGRFHDGRTAAAWPAEVRLAAGVLEFRAADRDFWWSLKGLSVEAAGEYVRLSHPSAPDARLVVSASDWRAEGGATAARLHRRNGSRELRLVGGLAAVGVAVAGLVFFGVPAASGPLARATPPELERKMGESFDAQLSLVFKACAADSGQAALADLGRRLAARADSPFPIRVRAVQAPIVNAFALPGGTILVTDDLIRMAETPDELSAVVAHEVAHVEKRHVMQAVWRSLGLGLVLDAVVGGGSGAGQQAVLLAGSFTDMRYSREAEAEADARGQALLHAAGLSSRGMGPFFARLAAKGDSEDARAVAELISSHPDSARRAAAARKREQAGAPALDAAQWRAVKAACGGAQSTKR